MTYHFKHRAISLLLAFALLLSMMPGGVLPVHSVESESNETVDTESVSTKEFDHLIDRVATFSEYYDTFMLAPLPSKVTGYENVQWSNAVNYSVYDYIGDDSALSDDEYYALYDAFYAIELVVKECYISAESHGALWFRVEAPEGETLPEIFQENPWIFAFYSGFEGEDMNIALNVQHADLLTGVYVEGAPEDTELVVEVPTVDGEALPGVFDIKMYDKDGNEWQPIDEEKTVQISIPVEGVEDGRYVDVYHFIDYAKDIDGDEETISTEGAPPEWIAILQSAISVCGDGIYVAAEITEHIVANGTMSIDTDSFSVYYYNSDDQIYATGDADVPTNPANLSGVGGDAGKYYFVNRGDWVYFYGSTFWNSKWTTVGDGAFGTVEKTDYSAGLMSMYSVYRVQISDSAGFYNKGYQITCDASGSSIYIVVMPELTVKFESHLTDWQSFVTVPADITGIFMGNCDPSDHDPANGKYAALNYTLPAATIADGVEGYTFKNWYVKHAPSYTFAAGQEISLSSETLQVDWDENTDHYTVVLVADFDYVPHKYTYVYGDGETENKTVEYLFEDILTIEDPTWEGYNFLYWEISSSDPVESWTTQFSNGQVPGGSTITNMYGDVTLTAIWAAAGDTAYTVRHMYESLTNPGTYEFTGETTTQYGTTGEKTDASLAKKSVAGFYVDETDANCYVNVEITGDGTAIAEIRYKRAETTITFVDPFDGNKELGKLTGTYGASVTGVPAPEKTNYVFMGWYTADYPDQNYIVATYPATNLTLYAKWNLEKITITLLDSDGITVLGKINEDATTEIERPVVTKTGYVLEGWYKNKELTNSVVFNDKYTITAEDDDTSWYAKWTEIKYKVKYDTDDGTLDGVTNPEKEYTITSMPTSIPVPTKAGYTFGGWYATEDCTGTAYTTTTLSAALQADDDHTITVYAQWTANDYTYNVVYKSSTGIELGSTTVTKKFGTTNTIAPPNFTGYTTPAAQSVTWDSTTAKTITFVYNPIEYSLTINYQYEGGGQAATAYTGSVAYGATYSVTSPSITGYTPDKATVSGTMGAGNVEVTVTYKANTYSVKFDANGGSGTMDNQSFTYGVAQALTANGFTRTGYTFAGWNTAADGSGVSYTNGQSVSNLTSAENGTVTLYAQWTVNKYTITWKNPDGTVLKTETYDYGQTPAWTGAIPAYSTTENGYTWTGWTPAITSVTGNAEYTATYTQWSTITWKNYDGTTLETDQVNTGDMPEYNGATPQKPADAQYIYTFSGWTPTVESATKHVTYTAVFSQTLRTYTVTWKNHDSTMLEMDENVPYGTVPTYDGATPSKAGNAQYSYTWTGWDPVVSAVTSDVTYVAQFSQTVNSYTVTFKDWNGDVLKTQTVEYGSAATAPADPTRTGYTFTGWDKTFNNVTGDLVVTAQYTINSYTVTFKDWNGDVLKTQTVEYGSAATAPADPSREGYTFSGWDVAFDNVTGDLVVTAQYTINSYTVTFKDHDGTTLKTQTVSHGSAATAPADPSRDGYTFTGWDVAFDNVTSDLTVTAQYSVKQYTITFVANGGSAVGNLSYNITTDLTLPINPTRTGYTFDGWKITVADGNWNTDNTYWHVSPLGTGYYGNITLTAQWKANSYTVTFNSNGGDGGAMSNQTFTYGVAQALTANGFTKTGYTFAGWNTAANGSGDSYTNGQSVSNLTSAENGTVTLYAQWTINTYTVTIECNGAMVTVTGAGSYLYNAVADITFAPTEGYRITGVVLNGSPWGTADISGGINKLRVDQNHLIQVTAEKITYEVTYDLGFYGNANVSTNQGDFSEQIKIYGEPLTLHNILPTATGHTFAGWDINGDKEKDYDVGDTIELNQDVKLTALWNPVPYEITYQVVGLPAGAIPEFAAQNGHYMDSITLQNPPVTGYTLQSMKAMSGGVELTITDGEITMPAGDVVVTLTYAPNSYTVTFNRNSGLGDMANQTFAYDEEKALTANGFTRTGYTFAGWNTAADGSGTSYTNGQLVSNLTATNGAEVTLYAQWNAVTYNIIYDLAGGTVSGNPATYTVESGVITLVNPAKIGFTFAGWTGTGLDGATMDVTIPAGSTGHRSYTATWTPNTDTQYTVYHYLQNLDGAGYALHLTQPLTGTTGASVTPALQTPVGFTAPSTQTVIISADGSTVVNYYYDRNSYQVTWNVDGATTEVSYLYGATIVKPADPGKTGHTFAGWTPAVPATMPAENLTFTATWTTNKYTVTWDVDGTTTTETYEYGATIVKPADPAKEGYTFANWTPAVPGTMPAENLIFTAQWTVNQYTVTFVLGNGQPDIVQTYAYGAPVTAPGAPSRAGYTFGGWDTSVPATMPAENLTFTATWTEILKKLTINKLVENLGENPIPGGQTFTFIVTMLNGKTYAQYQSGITVELTAGAQISLTAGDAANQFKVIFTMPDALAAGQTDDLGTITISGLPLGDYTVEEVPQKGYDSQFAGDANGDDKVEVVLSDSQGAAVQCTNQYPVYNGDLTIKNDVSPEYSVDTDYHGDEFTVRITLTPDPDALAVVKKYYAKFNSETVELDFTDKTELSFTVTMAANETLTISGLPIGGYTVEVVDILRGSTSVKGLYTSSITYDPNDKLITSDKSPDAVPEASIASTYHRTIGTLKVEKTIDNIGTVAAEAEERTFTFRVTLPDDVTKADFIAKYTAGDITWIDERSFTFTITFTSAVAAGDAVSQSKVFANVPSGDYEVAEIDTPVGFVPIVSPVTAKVRSGAEATATFVNQYPVYLITYQVVGEGGTVTVSGNNGVSVSEKVNKNAAAVGATANAAEGYRFVGWFSDSGCTGTPLSTALTYAPTKPDAGWSENLTVYAKFEPIGSLTIEKVVDNKDDAVLTNQSFTFTVTMPGGKKVADYVAVGGAVTAIDSANNSFTVTITIATVGANATASSMVTLNGLPMGAYTVKETGIASGFVSDWDGDTTTVILSGASASVTATCTNEYPVYRVDYIVEGPGGTVKLNNVAGNAASVYEIYNFVTGAPAGATATAASGYQFDGWYLNGVRVSTELTIFPAPAEENRVYKAKFVENTAHISFVIVDPNGYQFTADRDWVKLTTYSTTIGSATGDISSTVTDLSVVYKFMGWYSDPACTNKLSDELTYTPQKIDDLHVAATYYAKFAYNLTSLDITVQLATPLDEDQSFVLYLTDNATGNKLTVSVHVPASSTTGMATIMGVTVGHSYTVTLDSNWAWRYDNDPTWAYESVSSGSGFAASFTAEVDGTLSFIVAPSDNQWLDGYDWLDQWLNGTP